MKKFLFLAVVLVLIMFLISCAAPIVHTATLTVAETTVAEVTETTAPPTTVTETTAPVTAANNDIELFREAIKDYNITYKDFEYSSAIVDILNDYIDTKTKTLKMTKEEVGNRYMKLANKVQMDYMVITVVKEKILDKIGITEITPDMLKAVDLIIQWKENKEKEYEYTARYYYGEGADYDIKADELKTESENIADEYLKLTNSMK